jgi:tRNA G18 (ribose-2'-O)-methylase SpoU
MLKISYAEDINQLLTELKTTHHLVGLEQDPRAVLLPDYQPPAKLALLLGEEVKGLTAELRTECNDLIEIPLFGQKESFNVSVATGIALYAFTQ